MTVPFVIRELVARWRALGRPAQPGVAWRRAPWESAFPEHRPTLDALPDLLDRVAVRAACQDASADPRGATRAFLCVMVWGYFGTNYGPFRTRRALQQTNGSGSRLHAAIQTLARDGPIAAYRRLGDASDARLHGLGPAFGTKFMYFSQPPDQAVTALILDDLVASWLGRNVGLKLNPAVWRTETYNAYLRRMHEWARELDCRPDELEFCIFRAEADDRGNSWGTTEG
jgi:hypothetical protein